MYIFFFFLFRGIRVLSKQCGQRYTMIGDMLCKEEHDIVLLQEVSVALLSQNYQTEDSGIELQELCPEPFPESLNLFFFCAVLVLN